MRRLFLVGAFETLSWCRVRVDVMDPVSIRRARLDDADAMAAVHVQSWLETYAALLPAPFIAAQTIERRTAMWTLILSRDSQAQASGQTSDCFVVECAGHVVGFGNCCSQRDATLADAGLTGEFAAIYVLRRFHRQSIGTRLMRSMTAALIGRHHRGASAWVLRDNIDACRFYEGLGASVVTEKHERLDGTTIVERAYGWRGLSVLPLAPRSTP
jgi:ribosomal protein S18 acetylase RimI-like enzyme